MKKLLLISTLLIQLYSCSGDKNKTADASDSANGKDSDSQTGVTEETIEPIQNFDLKISYQEYTSEKCFEATEEYESDFCASKKLKLMVVSLPNTAISKKINAAIFKAATGKKMGSISPQAFVDDIQTTSEIYEAFTNASSVDFESKNGELFSITVNGSDYFYGAAHPSGSSQSLVFDLSTGGIINLKDLFKANFEKKLAKIAEKNFIRENGKDGWDFTPGNGSFPLPNHFLVGSKGLNFAFGQYEIGPYAAGMPSFFIPFEQLKQLIPPTSKLFKFL
jgi:hypothetical protein